jgi:hypothetical protein
MKNYSFDPPILMIKLQSFPGRRPIMAQAENSLHWFIVPHHHYRREDLTPASRLVLVERSPELPCVVDGSVPEAQKCFQCFRLSFLPFARHIEVRTLDPMAPGQLLEQAHVQ